MYQGIFQGNPGLNHLGSSVHYINFNIYSISLVYKLTELLIHISPEINGLKIQNVTI